MLVRTFSGKVNYYEILGLQPSAKPDQVKLAYRRLVKELHPDVAIGSHSEEKFRMVTEAYTVLSKLETRATYDLTQGSKEEIEHILSKKRDKDGLDVEEVKYAPHQFGYKRLKELAAERKKYNIDDFYRYRGGVPQKHLGAVRGSAYGSPNHKADAYDLNFVLKGHNQISKDLDYVGSVEAQEFKMSRTLDTDINTRARPYLRADIDYTFTQFITFKRHFLFYFGLFILLVASRIGFEAPKFRLQMAIKKVREAADASERPYEKAGMRAVSLSRI